MKETLKKNSGITLIALIITIIVMIILVAVTVNLANENGGLFVRTRQAKVDTAYRAEQENLLMYMYGEDYDAATGKLNLAGVQEKLVNDNNTSNRWGSITLNAARTELTVVGAQSGKTHIILSNGTIDGKPDASKDEGTPISEFTSGMELGKVSFAGTINKVKDFTSYKDSHGDYSIESISCHNSNGDTLKLNFTKAVDESTYAILISNFNESEESYTMYGGWLYVFEALDNVEIDDAGTLTTESAGWYTMDTNSGEIVKMTQMPEFDGYVVDNMSEEALKTSNMFFANVLVQK